MVFRGWNRTCEFSADRAGLLACGNLNKAVTALVKLEAGARGLTQLGLQLAFKRIEAEDDQLINNLGEMLGTHPMIIKRIDQLKRYAASAQFREFSERMSQNVSNLTPV
jgi:Zn-dependent protease with chaperone function